MTVTFEDNEFTTSELLVLMKRMYVGQLNGKNFTIDQIHRWVSLGKVPDAYGGFKITDVKRFVNLQLTVLTIDGLYRDFITVNFGELVNWQQYRLTTKRIKKRTRLGYTLAKRKLPDNQDFILPDNWKALGIKRNQLGNQSRR